MQRKIITDLPFTLGAHTLSVMRAIVRGKSENGVYLRGVSR